MFILHNEDESAEYSIPNETWLLCGRLDFRKDLIDQLRTYSTV